MTTNGFLKPVLANQGMNWRGPSDSDAGPSHGPGLQNSGPRIVLLKIIF